MWLNPSPAELGALPAKDEDASAFRSSWDASQLHIPVSLGSLRRSEGKHGDFLHVSMFSPQSLNQFLDCCGIPTKWGRRRRNFPRWLSNLYPTTGHDQWRFPCPWDFPRLLLAQALKINQNPSKPIKQYQTYKTHQIISDPTRRTRYVFLPHLLPIPISSNGVRSSSSRYTVSKIPRARSPSRANGTSKPRWNVIQQGFLHNFTMIIDGYQW